jgi:hypothetical protein
MRANHASIGHRLKLDPKVTADQRGHGVGVAIGVCQNIGEGQVEESVL